MTEDDFMRGYLRILTLLLALAIVMALSAPGVLAQSPAGSYDLAVSQTVGTTCSSGEPIALNGHLYFEYSFTTDPTTNTSRYEIGISSNLSGVGQATQTNYPENSAFGFGFPGASSPAQFTVQVASTLASKGSAPRLTLNQAINITVDTSGNISATVVGSSTQCAGS